MAAELGAHKGPPVPLAAAEGAIGAGDVACERHEQREGVLGGGDGVATRRVHDDDAALGGSFEVDVVDARAGAGDDLEAPGVGEGGGRDLRLAAYDQALVVREGLAQVAGGEAGAHVDIRTLPQQGDTFAAIGSAMRTRGRGRVSVTWCARGQRGIQGRWAWFSAYRRAPLRPAMARGGKAFGIARVRRCSRG